MTRGAVVWLTGLPASGKTTLAERIRDRLAAAGQTALLLDSDSLRPIIAADLGYQRAGRDEFYQRLGTLAALLARQGCAVLVAATAPSRAHREAARGLAPRFIEVYLRVPIEECASRDPKGLYARARAGEAPDLPGSGAPYEPPIDPDVVAAGGLDAQAIDAVVALLLPDQASRAIR